MIHHHNLPLLPHYSVGASLGTDMAAADGVKMEAPSWEGGRLGIADVQDKQQVSFLENLQLEVILE
jgi:hypothetical protein